MHKMYRHNPRVVSRSNLNSRDSLRYEPPGQFYFQQCFQISCAHVEVFVYQLILLLALRCRRREAWQLYAARLPNLAKGFHGQWRCVYWSRVPEGKYEVLALILVK